MADSIEELERLAALRDKGVLTQEEFERQKSLLLHSSAPPPAPPAAATPGTPAAIRLASASGSMMPWLVLGGVALLILVVAVVSMNGGRSNTGAATSTIPMSGPTASAAPPVPTTTTPGASVPGAPDSAAAASGGTLPDDNPLSGTWENRAALTQECPKLVAFMGSEVRMKATDAADDQLKTTPARYAIQGSDVIVTTAAGAATARVTGMQMTLGNCTYTRPGFGR